MNAKHIPTPWELTKDNLGIIAEHNKYISVMSGNWLKGVGEDNAKHIVHCVNMHDSLVKALKDMVENLGNDNIEQFEINAREILAKESEA